MSQKRTLLAVIASTAAWVLALLGIEYRTLSDDEEGNHITAVLRDNVRRVPWVWILLAVVSGFMMGHCFGN